MRQPDRVLSYFENQRPVLAVVTVSGLIYNLGLVVGPWFEGQLAQCLRRIELVPSAYPCHKEQDDNYLRIVPGMYPDLLRDLDTEDDGADKKYLTKEVPGQWRSLWLDVTVQKPPKKPLPLKKATPWLTICWAKPATGCTTISLIKRLRVAASSSVMLAYS